MFNVPLMIPAAYNASASKVYVLETGKRGGKRWTQVHTIHNAGVYLPNNRLDAGEWKVTQWVNGFPRIIHHFTVSETGEVTDLLYAQ